MKLIPRSKVYVILNFDFSLFHNSSVTFKDTFEKKVSGKCLPNCDYDTIIWSETMTSVGVIIPEMIQFEVYCFHLTWYMIKSYALLQTID